MPVYLHLANLIIDKKALAERYKGGIGQFRKDFAGEGEYFQEDNELFALARMNPDEFPEKKLIDAGLHFDYETKTSKDYVICSRYGGLLWQVDWLEIEVFYALHKDCTVEHRARVYQMKNITIDEVQRIFDAGGNPFETIK